MNITMQIAQGPVASRNVSTGHIWKTELMPE